MDHDARPLHILLTKQRGEDLLNITCLKLYQFRRISWWCLSIMESVLRSIMKYAMLDFFKVTVSQILRQSHLLEVGLTQIPEDHETLSIVRHA